MLSAKAPGKLILSGEHSVVYGAPAIAVAVTNTVTATFTPSESKFISLNSSAFADDDLNNRVLFATLNDLVERLDNCFEQFLNGALPIQSVLGSPQELLFYTAYQAGIKQSGSISLSSDIPTGAGMGSSAAVIAALLKMFESTSSVEVAESLKSNFFRKVKYCERLQHGRGSAIDAAAVTYGGMIKVQGDSVFPVSVEIGQGWYRYDTGTPCCSTGETVAVVRKKFAESDIWKRFSKTTEQFEASEGKVESLFSAIQDNHQLLNEIGVVPTDVVQLIEKIERLGGAAKICGAGAHTGQSAGQILVFLPDQNVDEISEKIGISLIPLEQQSDGAYRE